MVYLLVCIENLQLPELRCWIGCSVVGRLLTLLFCCRAALMDLFFFCWLRWPSEILHQFDWLFCGGKIVEAVILLQGCLHGLNLSTVTQVN